MSTVTIEEAQAKLSELIQNLAPGEEGRRRSLRLLATQPAGNGGRIQQELAGDRGRSLVTRAHADGRFEIIDRPVNTEDELIAIVGDCDVLVTRSYNRVSKRVIDAASNLELIAQGTSGTANIDMEAARQRGIAVINMPTLRAKEMVIG